MQGFLLAEVSLTIERSGKYVPAWTAFSSQAVLEDAMLRKVLLHRTPPGREDMAHRFSSVGMALYTAGNMIGTGTHQTLIGLADKGCGNLLWANFLLSGLLVTLSALPLLHLYAKYPSDDCLHRAAQNGFGRYWGGWISFINGQLVSIELLFAVTMQVSFFGRAASSTLLQGLVGEWTTALEKLVALGLLVVLWLAFRMRGVLFTANIAFWLGILELCTVGLLAVSSCLGWAVGSPLRAVTQLLDPAETQWESFPSGIHVAVFAYGGFPGMIQAGELVRNPQRDLPLGIVLACVLTMCVYVTMSASVLLVASPGAIRDFNTGFDGLRGILPETVLRGVSATVLSSVANNVMENSLVVISNLNHMTAPGGPLAFMNRGFFHSDTATFGMIMLLTMFKETIGLNFLGDAIDFALLLQFAVFALLSIAQRGRLAPPSLSFTLSLLSLAMNLLLGTWHFYHSSWKPMVALLLMVFAPLIFSPLQQPQQQPLSTKSE